MRVATNVKKDDGSRAIGTILDPTGPVFSMIKKGEAYYGETTILGNPTSRATNRSRTHLVTSSAFTMSAI